MLLCTHVSEVLPRWMPISKFSTHLLYNQIENQSSGFTLYLENNKEYMRTVLTFMDSMFVRTNQPSFYRTVDEIWRSVIFFFIRKMLGKKKEEKMSDLRMNL